ncbi:MAG: hypothetical protein LBK66_03555 [Spirochaetaceae bacterium]|nr:hypothetical protein [Spirochaetaceae bacterium]
MRNPLAGWQPRMQTPFSNPKAEAEVCFRYAGAERIETRWRGGLKL